MPAYAPTANTREKILGLARHYIQGIGYHSFNYRQIASDLAIKNASIHHYFPAKDDLGLAVIGQAMADFDAAAQSWAALPRPARVEALLDVYRRYLADGRKLCVVGSFGACYQDIAPALQTAIDSHVTQIATWLTRTLQEGRQSGEFTFRSTPEALTSAWMSTLVGSLNIGRTHGAKHFEQTLDCLRESLR
ncbi:TetR/AcrR family transcriptional regulator [Hymenobacter daeguensis]